MNNKLFIAAIISLFVFFFFNTCLIAQWISYYGVTSHNITGIQFLNSNLGFICTKYTPWPGSESGSLIKTINGGINWTMVYQGSQQQFTKIFFLNENTGFAKKVYTQGSSYIYRIDKTTNGGLNWTYSDVSTPLVDIYFIDVNTGWGVGYTHVYPVYTAYIKKTTNSGYTWNTITPGNYALISVKFFDLNTGIACGTIININKTTYKTIILKTVDGGDNWIVKDTTYLFEAKSMFFINQSTGYITGTGGYIIKTTDGGNNWQSLYTGISHSINSIYFINQNKGWFICGGSEMTAYIYYTDNAGLNWYVQYNNVYGRALSAIFMCNPYSGWASGVNGLLLKTTNGGSTFTNNLFANTPELFYLYQNYPNPFNPVTTIKFDVPETSEIKIIIYDITGRELETFVNEKLNAGSYSVNWNGSNYSSGIYFCKLETGEYTDVKKMILIK